MKRFYVTLSIAALLLILAGFTAGNLITAARLADRCTGNTPLAAQVYDIGAFPLPEFDAPGADILDLPRYPGAARVEHRQTFEKSLIVKEVEYVVPAELELVHDFYRDVFDAREWSVADVWFFQGEWTFFVIDGSREALVEIEARGPLVEVEIELSEIAGDSLHRYHSARRLKAISRAAHGGDERGFSRRVDLAAQIAHVDIDDIGYRVKVVIPDRQQDLLA
jgi:hypothetical protein